MESNNQSLHQTQGDSGLVCALDALADGTAEGLIVARLDRVAPQLAIQEAALAAAWKLGAQVFTVDAGEVHEDDPDDPMRTAMRQMRGVFAQLDRGQVVKRLRDGRRAKAATGRKAVGAYAYGYRGHGTGRERARFGAQSPRVAQTPPTHSTKLRQRGEPRWLSSARCSITRRT